MKLVQISISIFFLLLSFYSSPISFGQSMLDRYKNYGEVIISELATSPFPHLRRKNGHTYNEKFYSYEDHYSDSTVVIFIPKGYKPKFENDFVIHFHGWYNNVDSVLNQFKLIEQFYASGKNAILIIPQGPKNAPDSFGGKLEEKNKFMDFINEIAEILHQKKVISSKSVGKIILSGHSGAYRVISFILMRGGITENIKEVFLFDGLYGQLEKYTYWLDHYNGKFINIYTKDGGTKDQSENLMECLAEWRIPYIAKTEAELSDNDLQRNRIINIYSDLEHNDVIHIRSQFYNFLKASSLKDF